MHPGGAGGGGRLNAYCSTCEDFAVWVFRFSGFGTSEFEGLRFGVFREFWGFQVVDASGFGA